MILPLAESFEDAMAHIEYGTEPAAAIIGEDSVSIQLCGRGEWEAASLEDAKKMAIDFANSVA